MHSGASSEQLACLGANLCRHFVRDRHGAQCPLKLRVNRCTLFRGDREQAQDAGQKKAGRDERRQRLQNWRRFAIPLLREVEVNHGIEHFDRTTPTIFGSFMRSIFTGSGVHIALTIEPTLTVLN